MPDTHPSGDKRFKLLDAAMKKRQFQAHALLEVLHTAQELFGFLQADLLMYIARQLRLPPSRVYGSEVGACRLCLVEIEGSNKLVPSCLTAVAEGMNVTTNAPRLRDYRKMIVELRFAERNHVCSVCVANGHC